MSMKIKRGKLAALLVAGLMVFTGCVRSGVGVTIEENDTGTVEVSVGINEKYYESMMAQEGAEDIFDGKETAKLTDGDDSYICMVEHKKFWNLEELKTIEVVSGMVDHVIIDCTSRITDLFTPAAIEMSDRAIGIFSADLRGVSYRKAQAPLLTGEKFRFDDHLIFAGVARPYYALDEMEHVFCHLDGILPWSKEIDRSATEGTVFSAGKYCSERYLAALRMVRNRSTGGGVIYGAESDEQSE